MPYVVVKRLQHNKERYNPGDVAPRMSGTERERLLELGVIEEMLVSSESKASSEEKPKEVKHSKAELQVKAEELGLTVKASMTVDQLTDMIAEAEKGNAEADAGAQGNGLPDGVDANLVV